MRDNLRDKARTDFFTGVAKFMLEAMSRTSGW